ncbi:MAG: cyclic nucleotide-binding domain-containing protein [Deltaproteobacteria bacterium]|nr:cyclic nucleotide-binding domain-containing protein [Deltaproteobacteria bacterium]
MAKRVVEPHQLDDKTRERIEGLGFFTRFPAPQIEAILNACTIEEHDPGDEIIVEGEYGASIYLLLEGRVEVLHDGDLLRVLDQPGDFFGEMSLVDFSPRTAAVRALESCRVLNIDMAELDAQPEDDKFPLMYFFYSTFSQKLSQRLRASNKEIICLRRDLSQKDD